MFCNWNFDSLNAMKQLIVQYAFLMLNVFSQCIFSSMRKIAETIALDMATVPATGIGL